MQCSNAFYDCHQHFLGDASFRICPHHLKISVPVLSPIACSCVSATGVLKQNRLSKPKLLHDPIRYGKLNRNKDSSMLSQQHCHKTSLAKCWSCCSGSNDLGYIFRRVSACSWDTNCQLGRHDFHVVHLDSVFIHYHLFSTSEWWVFTTNINIMFHT